MGITHFDQSTFLAHRAIVADKITPEPPLMVALPGALAPVAADRLGALQDAGHPLEAIVARVNAVHLSHPRVAARVAEHRGWVTGPYDLAVKVEAELKAQQEAESMRRRAEIEAAILKAREADHAG